MEVKADRYVEDELWSLTKCSSNNTNKMGLRTKSEPGRAVLGQRAAWRRNAPHTKVLLPPCWNVQCHLANKNSFNWDIQVPFGLQITACSGTTCFTCDGTRCYWGPEQLVRWSRYSHSPWARAECGAPPVSSARFPGRWRRCLHPRSRPALGTRLSAGAPAPALRTRRRDAPAGPGPRGSHRRGAVGELPRAGEPGRVLLRRDRPRRPGRWAKEASGSPAGDERCLEHERPPGRRAREPAATSHFPPLEPAMKGSAAGEPVSLQTRPLTTNAQSGGPPRRKPLLLMWLDELLFF